MGFTSLLLFTNLLPVRTTRPTTGSTLASSKIFYNSIDAFVSGR
jgi:hypothetical protein